MKQSPPNHLPRARPRRPGEQARAQTILLLAIVFFLGIAVSAFWFYANSRSSPLPASAPTGASPAIQLSEGTRAVLRRLNSPLEIRSYSLLDPATVPDSLMAFAGRVDQLLAAYEQAGGGLIKVTRFNDLATANAAEANGLESFNADKGQPCYLGLALAFKTQKETLPRLSPEWEPALEPDLTRAISRLLDATRPAPVPVIAPRTHTNAPQEVRALIPDLNAVSVDEGKKILQAAALQDFTAATKEMQAQIKDAEQRLTQAQASGSEADKQAAMKNLQQVQAEQTEKLKDIAAKAKAQLDAFQQLKAAPH